MVPTGATECIVYIDESSGESLSQAVTSGHGDTGIYYGVPEWDQLTTLLMSPLRGCRPRAVPVA
jgi:hypothetical protein